VGSRDDERDLGNSASKLKNLDRTLVRSNTTLKLDHISPAMQLLTLPFSVPSNLCLKELGYYVAYAISRACLVSQAFLINLSSEGGPASVLSATV
jgi:hypothetical protein